MNGLYLYGLAGEHPPPVLPPSPPTTPPRGEGPFAAGFSQSENATSSEEVFTNLADCGSRSLPRPSPLGGVVGGDGGRTGGGCPLGQGLAGEPLSLLPLGTFAAVVGDLAARPAVTPDALARHDAVVRRLAALFPALLPARFGEWLPDARALAAALAPRAAEIAAALTLVHGCVQMNLRVFGEPALPEPALPPAEDPGDSGDSGGPGTRYLAARRRAASPGLPEVAALREALRPLLHAERIERHRPPQNPAEPGPQLLATARDLVSRGASEDYLRIVEGAASALAGRRVTVSGPFPPYAFAPGGLGGVGGPG